MAKLVVEKGRDKGKLLVLKESQVFLVGRDIKTHLKLRDHQASRRHLKITTKAGEALLEDLDSSNGTFVNGERVRSWKLRTGDKVMVGETLIFYLDDESEDSVSETQTVDTLATTGVRKGELTQREIAGYRVGRLLGRGGMGTVYEAIQVSLERRVAFKVLSAELAADQQFVDRFTAEARAAGSLNHPNLVQVYDVGVANDIRFYSMEYMAKGSVEDLLRKHGKLPVGHALAIAFDAARGLEYAERKGIVHRDIKPENLMISEDDVVKIGDLGIATQRRPGQKGTGDETISGSPHYIAPEQALGKSFDHRADLYALGVSLYQILSGDTPFDGASAREVILKHLHAVPPPLGPRAPGTAPEVLSLVERLMEKDPGKRPSSASVLLQELVPLLRQHPVTDETAARVDGFLAKRLELNIQGVGPPPRSPSGRSVPASTETNMLALKSTDRAPLPPTADAAAFRIVRKALVVVVALALAIAFGAGLFWLAASLRAKTKRIHDEHVVQLAAVQLLLEKDPAGCERDALALEKRCDAEGPPEDAREAHALAVTAGKKRLLAAEAERARKAEADLAETHKRLDAIAPDPADVEGIKKLEATTGELDQVAKHYPGTVAGEMAVTELKKASGELASAREARTLRLRDEAAVEKESKLQWSAMEDFCRSHRYDDAWLLYRNFRDKPEPTPARKKEAARLHAQLASTLKPAIQDAVKQAEELAKASEWRRARAAVETLLQKLEKLEDLAQPLRDELAKIARNEKGEQDEPANADQIRLSTAETDARDPIKKRRFEAAAAIFTKAAGEAQTADGKAALEWRAERLTLAGRAIKFLLDTVRERQEGAGIHVDVPAEGRIIHYVAYDAVDAPLGLRFHDADDARAGMDRKLAESTDDEVLDWARQAVQGVLVVAARTRRYLPCVALALELGRPEHAQQDFDEWVKRGGSIQESVKATGKKLRIDIERSK